MSGFSSGQAQMNVIMDGVGILSVGYGAARIAPRVLNVLGADAAVQRVGQGIGVAGRSITRMFNRRLVRETSTAYEFIPLNWSTMSKRMGNDAAHHARNNHGEINFNKQKQDLFYGNPMYHTDLAWRYAQYNKIKPIFDGKGDIYIIPYKNSGYAGGYGGQLNALDYIILITEPSSNKVITAYPSGRTPPLPKDYSFSFGIKNALNI